MKNLTRLKYVLISLDYHSLYFSNQRGDRNIYSYYGNGIKHPSTKYWKADLSPFVFGYGPKNSLRLLKEHIIAKTKIDTNSVMPKRTTSQGYIPLIGSQENYKFNNKYYTKVINGFNNFIINESEKEIVLQELDHLITNLKARNIIPIFFSTPTFKEYNHKLDSNIINNNAITTKILCEKYNMQFWDYAINNNFTKEEFFNGNHLNKKGSERFSKILMSELELYDN